MTLVSIVKADSPLTSTNLTKGYEKSKWVQMAVETNGLLMDDMTTFLAGKGDLGEKLALICQLGWGENAAINANMFIEYMMENKPESKRTGDDYCCMAYVLALGDYFEVSLAKETATTAVQKNPTSFGCNMILALITAQEHLHNNTWCDVYKVCDAVRTNTSLKRDMKPEAIKGIFDYIDIYKDECK